MTKTTIFVCTSCGAKEGKKSQGQGKILHERLAETLAGDDELRVEAVGCLSNCDRGISVGLSAQGKFSWLFGDRGHAPDDVFAIIHAARAHVAASDGFMAKSDRAKPVIARVPPPDFRSEND